MACGASLRESPGSTLQHEVPHAHAKKFSKGKLGLRTRARDSETLVPAPAKGTLSKGVPPPREGGPCLP